MISILHKPGNGEVHVTFTRATKLTEGSPWQRLEKSRQFEISAFGALAANLVEALFTNCTHEALQLIPTRLHVATWTNYFVFLRQIVRK